MGKLIVIEGIDGSGKAHPAIAGDVRLPVLAGTGGKEGAGRKNEN